MGWGKSVMQEAEGGGAFQLHCLPSCACERGGSEKKPRLCPAANGEERNVLGQTKFRPGALYHQSRLS